MWYYSAALVGSRVPYGEADVASSSLVELKSVLRMLRSLVFRMFDDFETSRLSLVLVCELSSKKIS